MASQLFVARERVLIAKHHEKLDDMSCPVFSKKLVLLDSTVLFVAHNARNTVVGPEGKL